MRYRTPLAFKTALEHRLRAEAERRNVPLARVRQLVIFDRFIARAFQIFGDRCILKGGVVVEFRLGGARTTKDIDVRLSGDPNLVLAQLQEAGRLDLEDYLSFEAARDRHHPELQAEGMAYDGQRFRVEARLGDKIYGQPFGVDVAFADALAGEVELIDGSALLSFAGIEPARFRVYPLETHIAEKLHAYTLPRERENSRLKDLPDIALLAMVRGIDGATLRAALHNTFTHRATHELPSQLPEPPRSWEPRYALLAREDALPWKTLASLYEATVSFLDPVLRGDGDRWDPNTWAWRTQ